MNFSSTQDVGRLGAALAEIVLSAAGMGYLIVPLRTMDTLFFFFFGQEEGFMKGAFGVGGMLESFVAREMSCSFFLPRVGVPWF